MGNGNPNSDRPPAIDRWFTLSLLVAIVGIELAFESDSSARMFALAGVVIVFGSIIAWRTFRHRHAAR
jgi:hypothetical protein